MEYENIMKVYIIGAGGFASELTNYIIDNNNKTNSNIIIEGYFDVTEEQYRLYSFNRPFLGSEKEFKFPKNSNVYVAIGNSEVRYKVFDFLKNQNINFPNFIHNTCLISSSAKLGIGNIFCPNVIIGPNTSIGNYNLINYQSAIPHDCIIGNMNIFSPNVQITGYCHIGDDNFFGVSSGCTPSVHIGDNNKVQAGVIINKNISNGNIVFTTEKVREMKLYKNKRSK